MRIGSVVSLLFSALIFLLPWVDVHCEQKGKNTGTLFYQTGLQVATGEMSEGSALKKLQEMGNKGGNGVAPGGMGDPMKDKNVPAAPLVFGYLGLVLLGAVLGLLLKRGKPSRVAIASCAAGALLVLAAQTLTGFPMKTAVEEKEANNNKPEPKAPVNPLGGADADDFMGGKPKFVFCYLLPFYAAWFLPGMAVLLTGLDILTAGNPRLKKRVVEDDGPDDNPFPE